MNLIAGNRTKYKSDIVEVARNHETVTSTEDAVFLVVSGQGESGDVEAWNSFSTEEARKIAKAMIEVADEFDAAVAEAKPQLPTEDGLYISGGYTHGDTFGYAIYRLRNGRWRRENDYDPSWSAEDDVKDLVELYGPLKRLFVQGTAF